MLNRTCTSNTVLQISDTDANFIIILIYTRLIMLKPLDDISKRMDIFL